MQLYLLEEWNPASLSWDTEAIVSDQDIAREWCDKISEYRQYRQKILDYIPITERD